MRAAVIRPHAAVVPTRVAVNPTGAAVILLRRAVVPARVAMIPKRAAVNRQGAGMVLRRAAVSSSASGNNVKNEDEGVATICYRCDTLIRGQAFFNALLTAADKWSEWVYRRPRRSF